MTLGACVGPCPWKRLQPWMCQGTWAQSGLLRFGPGHHGPCVRPLHRAGSWWPGARKEQTEMMPVPNETPKIIRPFDFEVMTLNMQYLASFPQDPAVARQPTRPCLPSYSLPESSRVYLHQPEPIF